MTRNDMQAAGISKQKDFKLWSFEAPVTSCSCGTSKASRVGALSPSEETSPFFPPTVPSRTRIVSDQLVVSQTKVHH